MFLLYFRMIGVYVVLFIAWWAVLITGKYPKGMFDFIVGTLRWAMRLSLYLGNMTDTYPAFTGRVLAGENENMTKNDYTTNREALGSIITD